MPRYWGACGRVIVEEAVGNTLDTFLDADWTFRVDLSLQLLNMIDMFVVSNNTSRFLLTVW